MNGGDDAIGALGLWPRPRLDRPARYVGLTWRQWGYASVAYTTGRWGAAALAPALPHLPSWALPAWIALVALAGAAAVFATWHGRDAYGLLGAWLAYAATPRISVWRPLPADDPAADAEEEEHDDGRADLDEPAADAANPGGWLVPARG